MSGKASQDHAAGRPAIVVLGGSSSTHARIPAQMAREAGYRVVLADTEPAVVPGALEYFDEVRCVVTASERVLATARDAVVHTQPERPIGPTQVFAPDRRRSVYGRLLLGRLRGRVLARIVREVRPGLVHVQGTDVGGMAAYYYLRRLGIADPARRPGLLAHLFSYQPRFAAIKRREEWLLAACDQVHTSSPVVARIYREHYGVPPEKLTVLVRGIDLNTFAPRAAAALDAARREWGVPADKFVLIHNRHLHPMYRVDVTVDAFIALAQRGHDVFLLLVRGSMWQQEYEQQMRARLAAAGLHDRVALLPPVLSAAQMAVALQLARCSINTVPFDAFPVSILESMYCRCVPVVRDLESYYMFVTDGETGFLCGGTGTDQYVEKIERLIRDPALRARLAETGAARVAAEGDVEIYRRRLLELVRRCWHVW